MTESEPSATIPPAPDLLPLEGVRLFSHLEVGALRELAGMGRIVAREAGRVVFAEGEEADGLYAILAGRVRVFGRDDRGHEVEFAVLSPGATFGELALLDGQPRSATVACLDPCAFFFLDRDGFFQLLSRPEIFPIRPLLSKLLADLGRMVRVTNERYFRELLTKHQLQAEMEIERHRSVAQMVAGVAHELNTPLGIINAAASIIAGRLGAETRAALGRDEESREVVADLLEAAQLIQGNIARANALVTSFKNLSVRQVTERQETVDLAALVAEVVRLFTISARRARLQVEVVDRLTRRQWQGYPGSLSQVLLNLLTNAERYAYPPGVGGTVEIVLAEEGPSESPRFAVCVRDFGRGIAPEHRAQVFEPFFTTGGEQGGTGLGLAIVQTLVTSVLRGTIALESEPGRGTSFRIVFPQTIPAGPG